MAGIDLSGPLLAAQADYKAKDWGSVSAGAKLDLDAAATFRRGINLELGAEALVQIDAAFRKFIAADINGEAHASARVQAQVQLPLDLFSEAGLAVRLQAVAEVAAAIKLSLGLNIGDFLALADQDPRLRGIGAKLMRILLEESTIEGGVMAKVAAAAMAYAGLSVSGNFVNNPGFTIAAEAGLGLKAGAGYRVFANFGINEPRRLVRRLVDAVVDETVLSLKAQLADPTTSALVEQLRIPCKIAFRSCLEIGFELAGSGAAFNAQAAPKLAQRCVQVALEEMQRAILSAVCDLSQQALDAGLEAIGFTNNSWAAVRNQRMALAAKLRAMPENSLDDDGSGSIVQKWTELFSAFADLVGAATAQHSAASNLKQPLAQLWAAIQLLLANIARISIGSARASVIGLSPSAVKTAFTGPVTQPPPVIADVIRAELNLPSSHVLTQDDLVIFLLRPATTTLLLAKFPQLSPVIGLLNDVGGDDVQALRRILGNINGLSFGGAVDAEATLAILLNGLESIVTSLVDQQIRPQLDDALANTPDYVRLYADEVVFATLRYAVTTVFRLIRDAVRTKQVTPTVLREACSAIILRLVGRVLVVSADVLSNFSLRQVSGALIDASGHVNDSNGVAKMIADATGFDRDFVAELLVEALEISAQALAPLPDTQRQRLRDLSFQALDVAPDVAPQDFLNSLKDDFFFPNAEAVGDLVKLMGEITRDRLQTAIAIVLERAARLVIEQLEKILQAVEQQVVAWIGDVEQLVESLAAELDELFDEISELERAVEVAWNQAVDALIEFANRLSTSTGRQKIENELFNHVYRQAKDILAGNVVYQMLPNAAKSTVRGVLRNVIRGSIDNAVMDRVLDEIGGVADDLDALVDDLRNVAPGPGIELRVLDIVVSHIDEAIRERFNGNPHMDITLTFNFFGERTIALGRVEFPTDAIMAVIRGAIGNTSILLQQINLAANRLSTFFDLNFDLDEARAHQKEIAVAYDTALRSVDDNNGVDAQVEIVSPRAADALNGDLDLKIDIAGVPRSFFGLEPGQARRVVITLNEMELVLTEFVVSEAATAKQAGAIASFDAAITKTSKPIIGGAIFDSSAAYKTKPYRIITKKPGSSGAVKGAVAPREVESLRQVAAGRLGRPVRPDGGIDFKAISSVREAIPTSNASTRVRLQTTIEAARLEPGINTITVSVVNGEMSRRRTAFVSFLVPEASNLESDSLRWPSSIDVLPVKKAAVVDLGVIGKFTQTNAAFSTGPLADRTALPAPAKAPRKAAKKSNPQRLSTGANKNVREAAAAKIIAGIEKRGSDTRAAIVAVGQSIVSIGRLREKRSGRWKNVVATRLGAVREIHLADEMHKTSTTIARPMRKRQPGTRVAIKPSRGKS